jgi:preprotein translocase subunit SecA
MRDGPSCTWKTISICVQSLNARRSQTWTQELLVDVFALAAETSERILGLRLFDVQLLGALVLAEGKIAEMQTGEGKTFEHARNVHLTDSGVARIEESLHCPNLYDLRYVPVLTAVQDALHAEVLLRRDVDYIVKINAIELVDEFKTMS